MNAIEKSKPKGLKSGFVEQQLKKSIQLHAINVHLYEPLCGKGTANGIGLDQPAGTVLANLCRIFCFKTILPHDSVIISPQNECFGGTGISWSVRAVRVSVCVQNTSFYQGAGWGIKSHLVTALVLTKTKINRVKECANTLNSETDSQA